MPDFTLEECAMLISRESLVSRGIGENDTVKDKLSMELYKKIQNEHRNQTPEQRTIYLARMRQKILVAVGDNLPSNLIPMYGIAAEMVQGMDNFQIEMSSIPKQYYLNRLATLTAISPRSNEGITILMINEWLEFQLSRIKDEISVLKTVKTFKLWYFLAYTFISVERNMRKVVLRGAILNGIFTLDYAEKVTNGLDYDCRLNLAALELEKENFKRENNC